MKLVLVFLLFAALLVTMIPGVANGQTSCNPNICKVAIDRTVSTTNWGVTIVSDSFNLNSTSPVTHVSVGIPGLVASHLKYAGAVETPSQASLQVTNLGTNTTIPGNFTALDVAFPIAKTGPYTFNMTTVYSGLLVYNQTGSTFQFTINPYPMDLRTLNITRASLTINRNDWPSPKIQPGNQTLTGQTFTTTTWKPFNSTLWKIQFSSGGTIQSILDTTASRTITITSNGSVQVTDNYNITNRGPTVSSITLVLPKAITGISVSDSIGMLANPAVTSSSDGTNTLAFVPRYTSVQTNQSTRAQISYQLSRQNYVSASTLDRYTLNFKLFDSVKFFQPTFVTKIATPTGFKLKSLTGQMYQMSGNQILLQASPLTPMSNLGFTVNYQLDPFWASINPLSWVLLLEAALAGVVLAVWARPAAAVTIATGRPQLINRFVELYDEKSSMRLEGDKIEEDVNRGAMNRSDYRRRRRTIELRTNEIDRALVPIKEELSAIGPRYQDMIKRIERAEAELQVVRSTGVDIRNQNRSGRMSRELYDSLSTDLVRRKERAQQTIDSIIINLREEIR